MAAGLTRDEIAARLRLAAKQPVGKKTRTEFVVANYARLLLDTDAYNELPRSITHRYFDFSMSQDKKLESVRKHMHLAAEQLNKLIGPDVRTTYVINSIERRITVTLERVVPDTVQPPPGPYLTAIKNRLIAADHAFKTTDVLADRVFCAYTRVLSGLLDESNKGIRSWASIEVFGIRATKSHVRVRQLITDAGERVTRELLGGTHRTSCTFELLESSPARISVHFDPIAPRKPIPAVTAMPALSAPYLTADLLARHAWPTERAFSAEDDMVCAALAANVARNADKLRDAKDGSVAWEAPYAEFFPGGRDQRANPRLTDAAARISRGLLGVFRVYASASDFPNPVVVRVYFSAMPGTATGLPPANLTLQYVAEAATLAAAHDEALVAAFFCLARAAVAAGLHARQLQFGQLHVVVSVEALREVLPRAAWDNLPQFVQALPAAPERICPGFSRVSYDGTRGCGVGVTLYTGTGVQ